MRIHLDKIASSTRNANLVPDVQVSENIVAEEGYIVAAKVLARKDHYNELEDVHGRMVKIQDGDIIAGVLGARKALRGYAGHVPTEIKIGDQLSLLNLGGLIGKCETSAEGMGAPIPVEILGSILSFPSFEERVGIPANIKKGPVAWTETVGPSAPVIYVSGTCMHTGKTTSCVEIIRELSHRGYRVAAAKLTGVSLLRDTLQMEDCGAVKSFNFTDAGVASTTNIPVLPIAGGILKALQSWEPDVIVAELGDGLAGEYGVSTILKNDELMALGKAHVLCASDPVAAWGAVRFFREQFHQEITIISGPVTDNDVGKNFVEKSLELPALNSRTNYKAIVDILVKRLNLHERT